MCGVCCVVQCEHWLSPVWIWWQVAVAVHVSKLRYPGHCHQMLGSRGVLGVNQWKPSSPTQPEVSLQSLPVIVSQLEQQSPTIPLTFHSCSTCQRTGSTTSTASLLPPRRHTGLFPLDHSPNAIFETALQVVIQHKPPTVSVLPTLSKSSAPAKSTGSSLAQEQQTPQFPGWFIVLSWLYGQLGIVALCGVRAVSKNSNSTLCPTNASRFHLMVVSHICTSSFLSLSLLHASIKARSMSDLHAVFKSAVAHRSPTKPKTPPLCTQEARGMGSASSMPRHLPQDGACLHCPAHVDRVSPPACRAQATP